MNEDLGIKYFYDRNLVENIELDIKSHPSDFIVQEVTNEKLCGFDFIIDLVKMAKSLDLLSDLAVKNRLIQESDLKFNEYKIEDIYSFNHQRLTVNEQFSDFLGQSGLSLDDLKIGGRSLVDFLNIEFIIEIKQKWAKVKESTITIDCGEGNKSLRAKLYKVLNQIPFITSKTVDGKIVVDFTTEGIFRTVACKVMHNSMDVVGKICRELDLKNGKVGMAGNKDKKAITFQEMSINANFWCIFDLAYENYDDRIFELISKNYEDPLSKFYTVKFEGEELMEITTNLEGKKTSITLEEFNLINLSNYLLIKFITDKKIERDTYLELIRRVEAILEEGMVNTEYYRSHVQFFSIERSDIKRLGDLRANKFTIKLNDVKNINDSTKFLNYFGVQRFGKCRNNHKIGEKILNKEYEEAVEMILRNSKGYEAYCEFRKEQVDCENKDDMLTQLQFKEVTKYCDSTEKYIYMMRNKGKSDKNIILGLKREIRMLYLHAFQSHLFNEAINEEVNKRQGKDLRDLDTLSLPLKKFNDKMLKGGERNVVAECYSLKKERRGEASIVSFFLNTSSYATLALRELTAKKIE